MVADNLENLDSGENPEQEKKVDGGERQLEEATHEPRAHVEASGDYQEAEGVQQAFESTVESAGQQVGEKPQQLDKDLPESEILGQQMTDKDLEQGIDPTKTIEDLEDPFGIDKSLDGGPLDSPHGPGHTPGSGQTPEGFDPGMDIPKEIPDPRSEKELPTGVGGAPILNPAKGPWAQGMAAEDTDGGYTTEEWNVIQLTKDALADARDASDAMAKDPSPANSARLAAATENFNEMAEVYNKTFGMYPGGGQQTPNPVGDDGYIEPPKSEDDIDKSKSPGTVSLEADVATGGKPGGSIDSSKSDGFVTDPADGQDSGKLKDSALKAGAEQITDPSEADRKRGKQKGKR
jgi:hypothetical protein